MCPVHPPVHSKGRPTHPARAAFAALFALLALALAGCAGIETGTPAAKTLAVTGGYQGNETLAVLLPNSGRFAGAAAMVRDGIVAAQEADPPANRPELRFYDSEGGSITALVDRAAAEGASLVIGPLQKPEVDALAGAASLPIPILALNLASGGKSPPANLYQFSLSPEDEAVTVARKAWEQGYRTVLVLYQEGTWGERISRAFRQEWQVLGGALAASRGLSPTTSDFSGTVAALSDRAATADFLFLVATSKLARRVWPDIRRGIGTDKPVFATSHVLDGRFDPQADRSLVGLNFVEIPWLVEASAGDAVSPKGLDSDLPRLYAMGVDAYRLGSRLQWMATDPKARLQGKTGILSMDSERRIERRLTLARIDAEGPTKLAASDVRGRDEPAATLHMVGTVPSLAALPQLAPQLAPRLAGVGPTGFPRLDEQVGTSR